MNYKICRIETLEELIEEHRNISQKVSVYEFDETSYTLFLIEINKVLKENQQLKEKINCDLKWALKYDKLYQENKQLKGNDQVMQEEIAKTWAKLDKKEEIINKAKQYIKNNSHKTEWGDLEQDNESIDINDDVTDTEFITDLLEILDNKGE